MAEIDPEAIVRALEKKAQDKILAKRLSNPDFEKDQLRVDKQVQEDGGILSKLKFPSKEEQIKTNLAMVKRLDDVGRMVGNPFGAGDAAEALANSLAKKMPFDDTVPPPFEGELAASHARTEEAKKRLGPNMAKALEIGGEIGVSIATTPLAMTVLGATAIGGVSGLVSDSAEKLFKEGRAPTMLEALTSAGLGAGLSGLGQFMGNRLARIFVEKGAAKTPVAAGGDRLVKNSVRQLGRAFKFADESEAVIPGDVLHKFITDSLANPRFVAKGLDANVNKAAWNGFNNLKRKIWALEPGQGMTIREVADARTAMRDVAAKGAGSSDLIFEIDHAFAKTVGRTLTSNPKGKLAWQLIEKHELPKMQAEFLSDMAAAAELEASQGGGRTLDRIMQQKFKDLVSTPAGQSRMVKLGFSPEQKELFREAAHGSDATILSNKLDKVTGSTWIAPFYRLTLQPLFRARGSADAQGDLTKIIGQAVDTPAADVIPPAFSAGGQAAVPIAPQIAPNIQQGFGMSPGSVTPGNTPAPTTGGPQRMPRPLTEQPARGPVPNLPKP